MSQTFFEYNYMRTVERKPNRYVLKSHIQWRPRQVPSNAIARVVKQKGWGGSWWVLGSKWIIY